MKFTGVNEDELTPKMHCKCAFQLGGGVEVCATKEDSNTCTAINKDVGFGRMQTAVQYTTGNARF